MNNSDKTGSYKLNKNISQVPRLMIAAEKSGCGKTTFTCGLLQLLKNRGKNPVAFKCGPDYIDPMFHEKVLDIPGTNLDSYFSDKEELQLLIKENCSGDSVAVIEGVMGIYDGISIESDRYSSYEVAENTDTPILLLMDARGVGRTLISKIKGILADDRNSLSVEFFRIWAVYVVSSQPRLNMPHWNLQIETSKSRNKCCAGISMHQNHIWLYFFKYSLDLIQNLSRYIEQSLALFHDCQVVIRNNVEYVQNLLKHFLVLASHANYRFDCRSALQFIYKWAHLNRFRTCAEY